LIKFTLTLSTKVLSRQLLDATLVRYITSTLNVILNPVLVIAILGFFGVETTTFAALLAGVGIAIGAAGAVSARVTATNLEDTQPQVQFAGESGKCTEITHFL
jgi:hypothetical protein